ncbi:MAG: ATP-dependent DNA helicase [bacterium]|nr:ATP-dependent DNA helicase [bacterium]
MIAFDETARTLHLSIEDLLDSGPHRPWDDEIDPGREALAADALSQYLDHVAPQGYLASTRIAFEFAWREYTVHLDGVADGLFETSSGEVVEVVRCVPASGGPERAIERAGLLCLLRSRTGHEVHKGRVAELSMLETRTTFIDVAFSTSAYGRTLEERLDRIERESLGVRSRARTRTGFAAELPFPFDEIRPGQDIIMSDVEGAAASGLMMLCSAPTGIGKTAAVLHPMLRRALLEDRKIFFVTSKVSQQKLALETLGRMLPPHSGAFAVQISARERICPIDEHGCLPGRCPQMRRFSERLDESGLLHDLAELGVADADAISHHSNLADLCPFEVGLELTLDASVVIGDFNYVFDPNVYLRRFFDESYAQHLLVVDEAHNLPARAQDYYSPQLDLGTLSALAQRCETLRAHAYRGIAQLLRDVVAHCTIFAETLAAVRGDAAPWVEAPEREFWESLSTRVAGAALDYHAQIATDGRPESLAPGFAAQNRFARSNTLPGATGEPRPRDPIRTALGAIRDFCRFSQGDPERTAALWTATSARLLCLDPAPRIAERLQGFHAAVCMSATLHPADFYTRALGIQGPETVQLDLPSPFPASNRLLLSVPDIDTTYRRRSEDAPRVAEILERCMSKRRGNYLAFFSSFAYRDEVMQHLTRSVARVLVQIPGMPTAPFLNQLEKNEDETLLLCAVHGGVFSEGVDYPAHMAIGVFVIGPGLPAVSLERELIREYYEHERGSGFEHAYVAPGMNRVVQAGGRAVRTPTDRAVIVLMGRRFGEPAYRERMPAWWQQEIIVADDPAAEIEAFWQRGRKTEDRAGG